MKSVINELWLGNIDPQNDSRNNSQKIKELMEYMKQTDFQRKTAT